MNIPKEAIEKAIEGGWKKGWRFDHLDRAFVFMEKVDATCKQPIVSWMWERVALDPAFWQGLGKALGWKDGQCILCGHSLEEALIHAIGCPLGMGMVSPPRHKNGSHYYAHRFYDLILTGGGTEQFWKGILEQ